MPRRMLRALLREPLYAVLVVALIAGAALGGLVTREEIGEGALALFGKAWRGTPDETRGLLVSMFGLQFTVLTIVLSLNAPLVQSAANQYSPRLVPFYLKSAPLRRAVPLFVLATGYILAAVRELGMIEVQASRPRPTVSGALILLVAAFLLLAIDMTRTFRFMRVERVLGLVRHSISRSAERVHASLRSLPLDGAAVLPLPPHARALAATAAGYLVRVDVPQLTHRARASGVRVRICRSIGEYVDAGEVIGWVVTDGMEPADPDVALRLAGALELSPTREPEYDPGYGIRILADVAARALSSSANDSYTARQALQQLRSALRHLAQLPLGDWNVVDPDRVVRVSVMATDLREFIALGVDAPLRYGANNLELLDAVLEIALEVGLVARSPEGRAVAHELVSQVLSDAAHYGGLDPSRLEHLLAEADLVRASIERDAPRATRLVRAHGTAWARSPAAHASP